jgi:hypothetical protein
MFWFGGAAEAQQLSGPPLVDLNVPAAALAFAAAVPYAGAPISINTVTGILSIDTDHCGALAALPIGVRATNSFGYDEDTLTVTVA